MEAIYTSRLDLPMQEHGVGSSIRARQRDRHGGRPVPRYRARYHRSFCRGVAEAAKDLGRDTHLQVTLVDARILDEYRTQGCGVSRNLPVAEQRQR